MNRRILGITEIASLQDLARNVAGISDHFLDHASAELLRGALRELRKDARDLIDAAVDRTGDP